MPKLMEEKKNEINKISNELSLEKYKPVMVLKLSRNATSSLGKDLKELGNNIMEKTGYPVLVFPNEEVTSGEIISVCESRIVEMDKIKEYIYEKNEESNFTETPFTTIKNIIEKRNE